MQTGVYHMSALALLSSLPAHSIGAVITDPPFFVGIGRDEGWKAETRGIGADPWSTASDIGAIVAWTDPVAAQIGRVLRKGGAFVVMGGSQSLAAWELCAPRHHLAWMAELTVLWNTGKPRLRNFGGLSTSVRWYCRQGARHTFNSGDVRSIYSNVLVCNKVPIPDRQHPAQKPVELTNFLVSLLTANTDVILDPFCGSGSTLVSAAMCARPYIGCDTDEAQCSIAATRVARVELEAAELRPLRLWVNGKLYDVGE